MLMVSIIMQSENTGGNQVSYLVRIARRSPNLMLAQSSHFVSWNTFRGRSSETLLSRDGGNSAVATAQCAPLHDKGWRKFPVICMAQGA